MCWWCLLSYKGSIIVCATNKLSNICASLNKCSTFVQETPVVRLQQSRITPLASQPISIAHVQIQSTQAMPHDAKIFMRMREMCHTHIIIIDTNGIYRQLLAPFHCFKYAPPPVEVADPSRSKCTPCPAKVWSPPRDQNAPHLQRSMTPYSRWTRPPPPRDQNAPLLQRTMTPYSRWTRPPPRDQNAPLLQRTMTPYSRWTRPPPRDQNAPLLQRTMTPYSRWTRPPPRDQNAPLLQRTMTPYSRWTRPPPRDQNAPLLQRTMTPSSRSKRTPPPANYDPYSRWARPPPRDQNAPLLQRTMTPTPDELDPLLEIKTHPSSTNSGILQLKSTPSSWNHPPPQWSHPPPKQWLYFWHYPPPIPPPPPPPNPYHVWTHCTVHVGLWN